jgi:hypothetical protein
MKNAINITKYILGFAILAISIAGILHPESLLPAGITGAFAIAVFQRACAKNVGGNATLFWTEMASMTSFSVTSGEISAVTPNAAARFMEAQGDIDSIMRKETGEGMGNNIKYLHRLEVKFQKPSKELNTLRNALADASPCGILAIVQDNNGKCWLMGWNQTDLKLRGLRLKQDVIESGAKPSDEANQCMIALETESGYVCLPFDATLSAAILGKTATAFITFGA